MRLIMNGGEVVEMIEIGEHNAEWKVNGGNEEVK
jgi:hypothetical protein